MTDTVSLEAYVDAMRLLPAAVTIITAGSGERRAGFTATSVTSVAAEPPHLLICATRGLETRRLIGECGHFAVNLLRFDQADLAERFAGRSGIEGEARFADRAWTTLESDCPTLPEACAVFDCRVVGEIAVATHDVIVGAVSAVHSDPNGRTLVYVDRDYGWVRATAR